MVQNDADDGADSADARSSLVDGAEDAVRAWLRPGRFRQGDRLPTEQQLAGMLGISRGTLRSALRRLEHSGEIVRRQGSGTFVGRLPSSQSEVPWLRPVSYVARAYDGPLSVVQMSIVREPVDDVAGSALSLAPGQTAVQIRRVFAAAGRPIALCHDVLHPDLQLPEIEQMREWLAGAGTVHAMLVRMVGLAVTLRRTRIASLLVGDTDPLVEQLGLDGVTACVTLEEVSLDGGRVVHRAYDVLVPGQVEVEVTQSAGGDRLPPTLGGH